MTRKNHKDKIIPLDSKQRKKAQESPAANRAPPHTIQIDLGVMHLLPVKLPYTDSSAFLANVPKHELGFQYVQEMQKCFPEYYFVDASHRSCQIDRIDFGGPHEVPENPRTLVAEHAREEGFPLLQVAVKGIRESETIEVANIIADPFGYDVFWHLLQKHPNTTFQTADFGNLPMSSIIASSIWNLNFST